MDLKPYIALLFFLVFIGKFLIVDAKILVAVLDTNEISYVNPYCKNRDGKANQGQTQENSFEASGDMAFQMDSICNALFKFEVFAWESKIIVEEPKMDSYYNTSIPEPVQDRFYPPPRA